eukprot:5995868-Karenia_brevis.AAC.1
MSILKSLLGGWCTGERFQVWGGKCIFGCTSSRDNWKHYGECNGLWAAVASVLPGFVARFEQPALFGIFPICQRQMFGLFLAYQAYHATRPSMCSFGNLQSAVRAA